MNPCNRLDISTYHYPFGMIMSGRNESAGSDYRYGFNGMEKDDEVKGDGNSYTTHFRQYDPRVSRWLSIDPKVTSWQSPYLAFSGNPIIFNDPKGDTIKYAQGATQELKNRIEGLRNGSDIFAAIYSNLDRSENVFEVTVDGTLEYGGKMTPAGRLDISATFADENKKNGAQPIYSNSSKIAFKSDKSSDGTIAEEFFHAYQVDMYGDDPDVYNTFYGNGQRHTQEIEAEAKFAVGMMIMESLASNGDGSSPVDLFHDLSSTPESFWEGPGPSIMQGAGLFTSEGKAFGYFSFLQGSGLAFSVVDGTDLSWYYIWLVRAEVLGTDAYEGTQRKLLPDAYNSLVPAVIIEGSGRESIGPLNEDGTF